MRMKKTSPPDLLELLAYFQAQNPEPEIKQDPLLNMYHLEFPYRQCTFCTLHLIRPGKNLINDPEELEKRELELNLNMTVSISFNQP